MEKSFVVIKLLIWDSKLVCSSRFYLIIIILFYTYIILIICTLYIIIYTKCIKCIKYHNKTKNIPNLFFLCSLWKHGTCQYKPSINCGSQDHLQISTLLKFLNNFYSLVATSEIMMPDARMWFFSFLYWNKLIFSMLLLVCLIINVF